MKIQKQPDYLIFADSAKKGENAEFPDISRGWGITIEQTASKPPMEWMNGAFNRVDKNILYLLQQGVPEWSEKVTYPVNAIIKYNGVLYTAIAENDNAMPTTNTNKWRKLQADDFNALPAQKKINGKTTNYDVGVATDFKNGLKSNGEDVLTKADLKISILYPGGSELSPPTLSCNQRIVIDNPFKTMNVIARLELYLESTWFDFQHLDDVGNLRGHGAKVTITSQNKIVVQSGNTTTLVNMAELGGNPFGTNTIYSSAQYRIRIIKIGD